MPEQRPGNAVIFKNRFKKDGDNSPDIKGFATTPAGERFELAFWKGDDGKYTGKIKPPRDTENRGSGRAADGQPIDDDIPF